MAGTKQQRHLPIGYRIQNGRAEIIPEEAELIQRIFQDYQEGATMRERNQQIGGHRA